MMQLVNLPRKSKKTYLIAALTLFLIEILIERFAHDDFIRPYLGDFFVVILIYAVVMSVSNFKVFTAAVATLIFSYFIETAQYFNLVTLLGLQEYKIARILIGTSFSWWDMLMYTLGIVVVVFLDSYDFKKK